MNKNMPKPAAIFIIPFQNVRLYPKPLKTSSSNKILEYGSVNVTPVRFGHIDITVIAAKGHTFLD